MSNDLKYSVIALAIVSIVNVPLVGSAYAQSGGAVLEEIVVTARKVEESIQDIPLSISAFTAEDIKKRSIEELEDVALQTPGLTFEDYSNGGFGTPIIRGASQFSIDALEQNVSTFIDGVYIPRQYAVDIGTLSLDRVEVVKGPQSALYGANAFMGAVNYVTRKADLNAVFADLEVTVGSDGRQDISGEISFPIKADVLAVKFSGATTEFDGDWKNSHPAATTFNGKGTDDTFSGYDNQSLGIAVVAQPTESLRLEIGYSVYETFLESRAQTRLSAFSGDLNCGAVAFGIFPKVWCGDLPNTPLAAGTGEATDFVVDPRSYSESETDLLRAEAAYEFNENWSVSYQYSNIQTDIFAPGNSDRTPLTGTVPFGGTEPANFFTILPAGNFDFDSSELRLEYSGDSGLYAMVGVFTSEVEDLDDGIPGFAGTLWTDGLQQINFADIPEASRNNAKTTNETTAFFGRVSVPLMGDKLILAAEGRFTDEEKTGADSTGEFVFEDSYFTPRVSLDYRYADDRLIYASIAQGVKSGGINAAVIRNSFFQFVPLPDDERFYGPDENITFEIGTKNTLFGGRMQLNATAYLIDWSELQVSTAAVGSTGTTQTITSNLGSAESTGLEVDLVYALTNSIRVNAGLALNDASYDSGTISQRVIRASLCDDVVCNSNGDIGGNQLPRSSDLQWNLGIQYDRAISSGLELFVRTDVVGQSEQYVEEINTATIPSRTLLNLRGGLSGERWSAELWVKNAADEKYVSNAFYIPSAFFVDYVPTYGNRRRMGLTVNYRF